MFSGGFCRTICWTALRPLVLVLVALLSPARPYQSVPPNIFLFACNIIAEIDERLATAYRRGLNRKLISSEPRTQHSQTVSCWTTLRPQMVKSGMLASVDHMIVLRLSIKGWSAYWRVALAGYDERDSLEYNYTTIIVGVIMRAKKNVIIF